MKKFKGTGIYGAITVGQALLLEPTEDDSSEDAVCADPLAELNRLRAASARAIRRLDALYNKACVETGEETAQIFAIHKMILTDPDFTDGVESKIDRNRLCAASAIRKTAVEMEKILTDTGDEYLRERADDVRDAANGLIEALKGDFDSQKKSALGESSENSVICAAELTPGLTVGLDKNKISAFVTAKGSRNSHTAILARSRGIPAVIGAGDAFLAGLHEGQTVAVNGYTGEVIVDPDPDTLLRLRDQAAADKAHRERLLSLKGVETKTADGRRIALYANIGSLSDLPAVLDSTAEGIGLLRSEFLFPGKSVPDEETQFEAYRKVLETMAGKRVVIRTLDIGTDKQAEVLGLPKEGNPALGYRAIRICLDRTDLFRTQLRALYRASHYGRLAILFPMIASVWEAQEAIRLCGHVREELAAEGIPTGGGVELGIMIETPASAILADKLAPLADFFSVGTNDLTQYTLACDRQSENLERYCDPHHEAVLRLIGHAAKCIHERGKRISICGELAADTTVTGKLLDLGIDGLSVSPASVLSVREAVLAHRAK